MSSRLQFRQNTVEQLELARDTVKSFVINVQRIDQIFDILKHERMIADLAQLHDGIVETFDTSASKNEISEE